MKFFKRGILLIFVLLSILACDLLGENKAPTGKIIIILKNGFTFNYDSDSLKSGDEVTMSADFTDEDGDKLEYKWEINNENLLNGFIYSGKSFNYNFEHSGKYYVSLDVKDSKDLTTTINIVIGVEESNTPPTGEIVVKSEKSPYTVGDKLILESFVRDVDEDEVDIKWEVILPNEKVDTDVDINKKNIENYELIIVGGKGYVFNLFIKDNKTDWMKVDSKIIFVTKNLPPEIQIVKYDKTELELGEVSYIEFDVNDEDPKEKLNIEAQLNNPQGEIKNISIENGYNIYLETTSEGNYILKIFITDTMGKKSEKTFNYYVSGVKEVDFDLKVDKNFYNKDEEVNIEVQGNFNPNYKIEYRKSEESEFKELEDGKIIKYQFDKNDKEIIFVRLKDNYFFSNEKKINLFSFDTINEYKYFNEYREFGKDYLSEKGNIVDKFGNRLEIKQDNKLYITSENNFIDIKNMKILDSDLNLIENIEDIDINKIENNIIEIKVKNSVEFEIYNLLKESKEKIYKSETLSSIINVVYPYVITSTGIHCFDSDNELKQIIATDIKFSENDLIKYIDETIVSASKYNDDLIIGAGKRIFIYKINSNSLQELQSVDSYIKDLKINDRKIYLNQVNGEFTVVDIEKNYEIILTKRPSDGEYNSFLLKDDVYLSYNNGFNSRIESGMVNEILGLKGVYIEDIEYIGTSYFFKKYYDSKIYKNSTISLSGAKEIFDRKNLKIEVTDDKLFLLEKGKIELIDSIENNIIVELKFDFPYDFKSIKYDEKTNKIYLSSSTEIIVLPQISE